MPRLNQLWFDEVQLLPFWAGHVDDYPPLPLIRPYHLHARLLAHRENRMFWRDDVLIIDSQENIPWLYTGSKSGATCVHTLKDPALAILCLIFQVGRAQRRTA